MHRSCHWFFMGGVRSCGGAGGGAHGGEGASYFEYETVQRFKTGPDLGAKATARHHTVCATGPRATRAALITKQPKAFAAPRHSRPTARNSACYKPHGFFPHLLQASVNPRAVAESTAQKSSTHRRLRSAPRVLARVSIRREAAAGGFPQSLHALLCSPCIGRDEKSR